MSWDTYVKNLVDGGMKDGAIAGLENGGWMVAAPGSTVIKSHFARKYRIP